LQDISPPGLHGDCYVQDIFVQDIYVRDMLYALTIRSPVAKGVLVSIDSPRLPEGYAIISAKDIPGENRLAGSPMPIFADARLSYKGEPVALLFGADKLKLHEIFSQVKVVAEETEPFFAYTTAGGDDARVIAKRTLQSGDTAAAFESAAQIIENEYDTGIQDHWYTEPAGAVSMYGAQGALLVRTSTQKPDHVKLAVAQTLGISQDALELAPTILGEHSDGKLWYPSLVACHCALASFVSKKPVRLILSREEDFLFSPKRCESKIKIKSAVDEKGLCTAAEISVYVNLGAYGIFTDEIIEQICIGSLGCYNIENIKLDCRAVSTNTPPGGPFCGFGLSQGLFASECQAGIIAGKTKTDPVQWRVQHLKTKPNTGLIETALSMSDYGRKWASYELLRKSRAGAAANSDIFEWGRDGEGLRGIGMAAGFQSGLPGENGGAAVAVVEIEMDAVEYTPKVRGIWLCIDGGKILSVDEARKSAKTGAMQAAGWAAWEYLRYVQGVIDLDQYDNYKIAHAIGGLNIRFLDTASEKPKSIGELPFTCIPAAYIGAVSQAMDCHFFSIPLKKEEILESQKNKGKT